MPEVKTVLSGVLRPSLLSVRAVAAKLGGVTLAVAGGLSVGKEGPFVHVAAATADSLMRLLPPFRSVTTHSARRLEVASRGRVVFFQCGWHGEKRRKEEKKKRLLAVMTQTLLICGCGFLYFFVSSCVFE